jgi:uncharacterized protein YqeY
MPLKDQIASDLKQALKAGDDTRKRTLRLIMAAVHNAEIEKGAELDDLVDKEEAEAAVLQGYLPAAMSREEIAEAARKVIAEVGAQGPRDMGKVMGPLTAQLRGRADGSEVAAVVRELLAGMS